MTAFRRATAADVDSIAALMRVFYADDGYPFDDAIAGAALADLVREPLHGAVWVSETDGAIVAYLAVTLGYSLEFGGLTAFVDELVVTEAAQRKGLGRAAMAVAEAHCRAVGVRALHLEVEPDKDGAQRLYRESGFVDHGRRLMTKRLVP